MAEQLLFRVRQCRVCGCTDDDCSECFEATGAPCEWVADDLCSRCEDEESGLATWTCSFELSHRGPKGGRLFAPLTNARGHTRFGLAAKAKSEKRAFRRAWEEAGKPFPPAFPVEVTFVRCSSVEADDDNLRSAYKAARDELANIFGLRNDHGAEVGWEYQWQRAKPGQIKTIVMLTCVYERTKEEEQEGGSR